MSYSISYNPATQHTAPKFAPLPLLTQWELQELSKAGAFYKELLNGDDAMETFRNTFTGMTMTRHVWQDGNLLQNKKSLRFFIKGHSVEIDILSEPFYPR